MVECFMGPYDRRMHARDRLIEILRRHVEAEDYELSDAQLVEAAYKRWRYWYYDVPVLDPNE